MGLDCPKMLVGISQKVGFTPVSKTRANKLHVPAAVRASMAGLQTTLSSLLAHHLVAHLVFTGLSTGLEGNGSRWGWGDV